MIVNTLLRVYECVCVYLEGKNERSKNTERKSDHLKANEVRLLNWNMASVEINMFKSAECLSDLAGGLRHSCLFERVYLDFNPLRPRLMIIFILS